jgi:cytochrome c oxidase cbb3-type subunit 4
MNFDYHAMRTFADSWGLLYMTVVFLGIVLWTLRPGARKAGEDAAKIPFKED